jgi:hypothetical protein
MPNRCAIRKASPTLILGVTTPSCIGVEFGERPGQNSQAAEALDDPPCTDCSYGHDHFIPDAKGSRDRILDVQGFIKRRDYDRETHLAAILAPLHGRRNQGPGVGDQNAAVKQDLPAAEELSGAPPGTGKTEIAWTCA